MSRSRWSKFANEVFLWWDASLGHFSRAWHSDEISAAGDLRSRQGGNLVLFSSRLKIRRWVKTVDWNVCCAVVFFSDLNGFRKTIGTSRIETNVYYERHSIQKDRSHGENVKLTTGSFAWAKVQLRVFTSPLSDFHLPFNFSMVSFSHSFPGASSSVIILTPPPLSPLLSPLSSKGHYLDYCDAIENTGVWGGQPEILALTRAYKTQIHVVQSGSPVLKVGEGEQKGEPLMISWVFDWALCYVNLSFCLLQRVYFEARSDSKSFNQWEPTSSRASSSHLSLIAISISIATDDFPFSLNWRSLAH